MNAAFNRSLLTGLACWLLSGCGAVNGPAVVDIIRTIDRSDGITSEDYDELTDISDQVFRQIRDLDPQIYPQLTLFTSRNFVQHINQRTQSGFGPDLIVTDSETALELYRLDLIDPISLPLKNGQDTPQSLLDLVTAEDGALVARPVQQFVQLACFNKSRLPAPPGSLNELAQTSSDSTFGLAIQLKDLYWSAQAFNATPAFQAAIKGSTVSDESRARVTAWLQWLVGSSYQQNIRFLNSQKLLRQGLIKGELDWITCWSSNLKRLKAQMGDNLGIAALPQGPAERRRASTKLEVWALGKNSSPLQRRKALVMLEFITKPWAQKTYSLMSSSAMPVSKKAAAIVASKIPGGREALNNFAQSNEKRLKPVRVKALIFRDPLKYEKVSDALLDTIYDIATPQESTKAILRDLREEN